MNRRSGSKTRAPATGGAIARWIVVALLAGVPGVYWTGSSDAYGVVKWTLLMVGAIGLAVLLVSDLLSGRGIELRGFRGLVPVAVVLAAAVVATVVSDSLWTSIVGAYSYYQGLLTFLALTVVVMAVLAARWDPGRAVLAGVAVGGGVVACLTGLQFAGILDHRLYGRVATPLGNSNFGAALLALTVPAVLYWALSDERPSWERWAAAGVAAIAAVESVAIGSSQGPFTLVASVGTVALLWGLYHLGWKRTMAAAAGVAAIALVVVAVGWSRISAEVTDSARVGRYGAWVSAWQMFGENPVAGVGLDRFEQRYPEFRPEYSAVNEGFVNAGQAHNVVLDLLADGGMLLGGAYVVLVGYTGYRTVGGLRRAFHERDDAHFATFSAIVAVWVGYQVQSLVSIDHVPLALIHWTTMAAIFRLSSPRKDAEVLIVGRSKRPTSSAPVHPAAAIAGVVALWFLLIPLRADMAAGEARRLASEGRAERAADELERATSLVAFRPNYWTERGLAVQGVGGAEAAAPFIERGAELNRGNSRSAMMLAQFYVATGDGDSAERWFLEALDRDPLNPVILQQAAAFFADTGQQDRASELRAQRQQLPEPRS